MASACLTSSSPGTQAAPILPQPKTKGHKDYPLWPFVMKKGGLSDYSASDSDFAIHRSNNRPPEIEHPQLDSDSRLQLQRHNQLRVRKPSQH
jgi:hypothetical protein